MYYSADIYSTTSLAVIEFITLTLASFVIKALLPDKLTRNAKCGHGEPLKVLVLGLQTK